MFAVIFFPQDNKQPKVTKAEQTYQSALALLATEKSWDIRQHHDHIGRKKEVLDRISKIGNMARKCSALVDSPQAQDLAERLFERELFSEQRHATVTEVKESFFTYVLKQLDEAQQLIWAEADDGFLSTVICSNAMVLVEYIAGRKDGAAQVQALVFALRHSPVPDSSFKSGLHFGFSLLKNVALVHAGQRSSVLALAEKVLKGTDAASAIAIGHAITGELPLDILRDKYKKDDHSELESAMIAGFSQTSITDLHCLRMCCLSLEYALNAKLVMPHDLRIAAAELVQNKEMISPRLRSLFKLVCGAKAQNGRTSWDHMEKVETALRDVLAASDPVEVQTRK